jgi:diguanylate cyclase (GGDEF)-like protein
MSSTRRSIQDAARAPFVKPTLRKTSTAIEHLVASPKDTSASVPERRSRPQSPRTAGKVQEVARKQDLQELLGELAQVDLLTELPSRSQFLDRLTGAMARARRNTTLLAVMLLNVDHFKVVNRTHGHRLADLVLKELAGRLKASTRLSDTIGRLGGDEFAVVLEGLHERQGAMIAANRALQVVSAEAFLIDGIEIRVTATIGVGFYPIGAEDIDTLLRHVDAAMSYAKEHAPGKCQLYSPELDLRSQHDEVRRAHIEQNLRSLTPREREVLGILVEGKANKLIAYLLGASTRTIENHRAKIMAKMQAESLPDLVRMVLTAQGSSFASPATV